MCLFMLSNLVTTAVSYHLVHAALTIHLFHDVSMKLLTALYSATFRLLQFAGDSPYKMSILHIRLVQ